MKREAAVISRRNISGNRFALVLRLAAPYIAVGVFWILFHNAWLAILAYHAQILWWAWGSHPKLVRPGPTLTSWLILPSALAGPLLYFLLPYVTRADLSGWLTHNRLSGTGFLFMVFYFGLVHPALEQIHWAPLRETTPFAHFAFAGYHMLVLYSLLTLPWLALCFLVLVVASWLWQQMARESGSLLPPIASHAVADFGIIIAVWLQT